MRRLHAIGTRERFVASGVYTLANRTYEHWSAHQVGENALFLRVDRDGRQAGAGSLLQEALRNAAGFFERIDQQLYAADGRPVARLRCTRFAGHVDLSRESRAHPVVERVDMDGAFLLVPGGILLSGMALAQARRLSRPLRRLCIWPDSDDFVWRCDVATAWCGGAGSFEVSGHERTGRRGGWHDSRMICWVDSHDVALRCKDEAGVSMLTQYARRRHA